MSQIDNLTTLVSEEVSLFQITESNIGSNFRLPSNNLLACSLAYSTSEPPSITKLPMNNFSSPHTCIEPVRVPQITIASAATTDYKAVSSLICHYQFLKINPIKIIEFPSHEKTPNKVKKDSFSRKSLICSDRSFRIKKKVVSSDSYDKKKLHTQRDFHGSTIKEPAKASTTVPLIFQKKTPKYTVHNKTKRPQQLYERLNQYHTEKRQILQESLLLCNGVTVDLLKNTSQKNQHKHMRW